jgi:hypothetical protein
MALDPGFALRSPCSAPSSGASIHGRPCDAFVAPCPAQRCFGQKAWFLPEAPPSVAAGGFPVPEEMALVPGMIEP